jgi:hypothetical protein
MQIFLAALVGQSGGWLLLLLQNTCVQKVELSFLLEIRELVLP